VKGIDTEDEDDPVSEAYAGVCKVVECEDFRCFHPCDSVIQVDTGKRFVQ